MNIIFLAILSIAQRISLIESSREEMYQSQDVEYCETISMCSEVICMKEQEMVALLFLYSLRNFAEIPVNFQVQEIFVRCHRHWCLDSDQCIDYPMKMIAIFVDSPLNPSMRFDNDGYFQQACVSIPAMEYLSYLEENARPIPVWLTQFCFECE
jgi:hypothetical protein